MLKDFIKIIQHQLYTIYRNYSFILLMTHIQSFYIITNYTPFHVQVYLSYGFYNM